MKKRFLSLAFIFQALFAFAQNNTKPAELYPLWTGRAIEKSEDIPLLKNVTFKTIKKYEPEVDGYKFMHGVAIVRYKDQWVASFGHNKGKENTGTEMANSVTSADGDQWSSLVTIDSSRNELAVSHGVFLVHNEQLWAFLGSFFNATELVHTRAYSFDPIAKRWEHKGIVATDGFWPMQEPIQMQNGEWIMAGLSIVIGRETQPAVAVCKNDKFTRWEVRRVPSSTKVWGECTILVDGANILLISRSANNTPKMEGMSHPLAYVSLSSDYGKTWSGLKPSNLPMTASKPYAGILSNGQRYLVNTISANAGNNRTPLTIALSKPNENSFSKLYRIRDAETGQTPSQAKFSYPYAVEYNGSLWVVYSRKFSEYNTKGTNNNSAELAIIPIEELRVN